MSFDELAKQLWPFLLKYLPLGDLAKVLTPAITQLQLSQPRIWGDPSRFINRNTVNCCNVLINTRCGTVTIESDVLVGHNVSLLTGTHNYKVHGMNRIKDVPTESHRDIIVESGVWLASGVTVIGPARIGEHAVICANSLVIGDVKAGWIYSGSPAVPIRKITFDD
ncbi:acyltransferase [Pectobacterium carotovorum]|uniref:acyltransferase n=1 Tax=Pectobacterium carotovorum TaxID=554 RepID=UPI001E352317|nr:acyltransferase [Pectobacterium carotovorum]UFT92894.1 acyltransferase [Pectobacterium carotovorum]